MIIYFRTMGENFYSGEFSPNTVVHFWDVPCEWVGYDHNSMTVTVGFLPHRIVKGLHGLTVVGKPNRETHNLPVIWSRS